MSEKTTTPYTAEELLERAGREADRLHVPASLRDDAVQEYVLAAMMAGAKGGNNPRANQRARGRGAILDFWTGEIRAEKRSPPSCAVGATRVLLDMPVEGMDGEPTTLAETIKDRNMPAPDAGLLAADRKAAVNAALMRLTPGQRDAAVKVWVQGQTQDEAAADMGKTCDEIRTLLKNARRKLVFSLHDYKHDSVRM